MGRRVSGMFVINFGTPVCFFAFGLAGVLIGGNQKSKALLLRGGIFVSYLPFSTLLCSPTARHAIYLYTRHRFNVLTKKPLPLVFKKKKKEINLYTSVHFSFLTHSGIIICSLYHRKPPKNCAAEMRLYRNLLSILLQNQK